MPEEIIRIACRINADQTETVCLIEALIYEQDAGPDKLISRTLADAMMNGDADTEAPERIWRSLFGTSAIGFDLEHGPGWVTILDDRGRANPVLVGKLLQIILVRLLPLSFTYASDNASLPDRFGGGCVIVTGCEVTTHDARAKAARSRPGAPGA